MRLNTIKVIFFLSLQDLMAKKRECLQAYSWWRTPQKKRKKKNKIKPGRIEFVPSSTNSVR